ncbi:MAG: GTPase domain-containing protein [Deltaproteobacteria bacterium]|nr:GTPase domain-containing protein [Deltaproteobacteria bacterium]
MAVINLRNKEIQCKIVYYGPGRSGKTSSLVYVYNTLQSKVKSKMVIIKTEEEKTLFFDFFPLSLGKIQNFDIKLQLYTVPGQIMYASTRRLILKGVDGIIFVADSQFTKRKENIESIRDLEESLKNEKLSLSNIPLVFQYNKRDLAKEDMHLLSVEDLEYDLNNSFKAPYFLTSAIRGYGVTNALRTISKLIIQYVSNKFARSRITKEEIYAGR